MRLAYLLVVVCGMGILLSQLFYAIAPTQFLLTSMVVFDLGLAFTFIATLTIGLVRWKKTTRWWLGPAVLCIAFTLSIFLIRNAGVWTAIDHLQFQKHMGDYVKTVDIIKSGAVPCNSSFARLDVTNLPPRVSSVWGARCPDGSMFVEFNLKPHIPQTSRGYLFQNYTETNNCFEDSIKPEHRYRLSRIADNWYEFRN